MFVCNRCSKHTFRRFLPMWPILCRLKVCRSMDLTLPFIRINDRVLDYRRSAGNGADNHELFRQGRALYVAVARMLDRFGDNDHFARHCLARKECDAARDPKRNRTARARREPGTIGANRQLRPVLTGSDRARCAPAFAWTTFG